MTRYKKCVYTLLVPYKKCKIKADIRYKKCKTGWRESDGTRIDEGFAPMAGISAAEAARPEGGPAGWQDMAHEGIWQAVLRKDSLCQF